MRTRILRKRIAAAARASLVAALTAALIAAGLFALSGCGAVADKAQQAADSAADAAAGAVGKAAEIAGEATANFIGTTAGNVGKSYNATIVERFGKLSISVDSVESEAAGGENRYTIDLTLVNSAPASEKMYVDILLDDYYLVACDADDYVYSLTPYDPYEDEDDEDDTYYEENYDNMIVPGKSRLTVYTSLPEEASVDHLLFLEKAVPIDGSANVAGSVSSVKKDASASGQEKYASEEGAELLTMKSLDLDGAEFDVSKEKGDKLTVFNVWATWCPPCVEELPAIAKISTEYGSKGVVVIGIMLDALGEDGKTVDEKAIASAHELLDEAGALYPSIIPTSSLIKGVLADVDAIPTSFIIGADGSLKDTIVGSMDYAAWKKAVDKALSE
jgi:thiol-disulfide isomerase/thioredoxin